MPPILADILPYLSILISIGLAMGGYIALRTGQASQAGVLQGQVIEALQAQVGVLQRQVDGERQEIVRMQQVLATIQIALRKRGLKIEVDDTLVTIHDEQDRGDKVITIAIAPPPRDDDTAIEGGKLDAPRD